MLATKPPSRRTISILYWSAACRHLAEQIPRFHLWCACERACSRNIRSRRDHIIMAIVDSTMLMPALFYFFFPNHCAVYGNSNWFRNSISIQYIQFDWNLSRDKAREFEQSFSICPNWYCSVLDACRKHCVCSLFEMKWMPLDWHIQCSFMWKKITEHIVITIYMAFYLLLMEILFRMGNARCADFSLGYRL